MRVLIFHGYLLEGTGSNVYNARLAATLARLGHEVHLLCQERHPERLGFINAYADWEGGTLCVHELRSQDAASAPGSCTVYRPNIGGLLPVYVADRYEGMQARTFAQCSDTEIASYVDANVAAVEQVLELAAPQLALANHLVMGPVILARALAGRIPYAVTVHGSALEYTVKPDPERFLGFAREGLAGAAAVLVGSRHTAESLWRALDDGVLRERTRLGPPGVDVGRFALREPDAAAAGLLALAVQLRRSAGGPSEQAQAGAFARDAAAAASQLERVHPEHERLVAFVGKLIVSKGVDLLLAAWPLVTQQVPGARLLVVGFGAYRDGLERLCATLQAGDLAGAREIALAGRSLEDPQEPRLTLRYLLAFLESLEGLERDRYLAAARRLDEQVLMCGRLEHEEVAELLPACSALVVPSTFPEAFGMVAAEAAACGVLPISAAHSGLAEVSGALARAVPAQVRGLLAFALDERAVRALAGNLIAWLRIDEQLRRRTRASLVEVARECWSWEGVARGVIAAAEGRLDELPAP